MNSQFLAGASDIIECFVRELRVLQRDLKAEEVRATSAEAAAREDDEMGLSVLGITQTALEITRQRLANQRSANKVLEQASKEAQAKIQALAEKAAEKELELKEKVQSIEAALNERNGELETAKQDLSIAHKDNAKLMLELVKQKSRVKEGVNEVRCPLCKSCIVEAKDKDFKRVSKELLQTRVQMELQKGQLSVNHRQLRHLSRQASGARSVAAMANARHKMARQMRQKAKQELQCEQAAHEELKDTCRELIELVENFQLHEVEGDDSRESRHSHEEVQCKYQRKYRKLKQKIREQQENWAELSANVGVSASKKRKSTETPDQTKNKRRTTQ
ncbi:hypothetical protein C8R45DRAFT_1043105 [Mycena sanguinolenta]|nr:hypothetical protein C8R45DRAFT_1047779 [Mycena sanguinolenta]KAJ6450657.1 hypothetical protein C8R45DRAFT_1043105 [Mycena sanguinolenta]